MIASLTLHWGILPHIAQWRTPIELRASRALGMPVRIGDITVRSSGWVPSFELRDVVLLDPQQRPALTLPRVAASISPRGLLGWQLNFEQLLIEGARLEVRRDAAGRITVGGLALGAAEGDGAAADWFFRQHEITIRGGTLRWTDEMRGAPPLTLSDVQFVVRNRLLRHDMSLTATPDAAWGERFSLAGEFSHGLLARPGDWQHWSGNAYASLPRTDLRELRRHVTLPFELSEGDGGLRGWFDFKDGQARTATVDLALRAVTLQLSSSVQPLRVAQVEGRLVGERDDEGMALAAQHLSFVTGDGIRWPQSDMSVRWRQRAGLASTGGEFSAQRLDLAVMAQMATRVPMSLALRRHLAELKPRGVVSELHARWDGPLDAPTHYQADGVVAGLTLAARAPTEPHGVGRPGLRNATVTLTASETGGEAQLTLAKGELEFPGVFEEPVVPIDQLSAKLQWKLDAAAAGGAGPKLSVTVKDAKFANADAQGELSASWRTGSAAEGRYPGFLELDGKLGRGLAARTARYLPLAIPAVARDYVADAVRSGHVPAASFHVKGALRDFPYLDAASPGEFRIVAEAEDVSFAYVPSTPARGTEPAFVSNWPAFNGVAGELVFDRASMAVHKASAHLGALHLSQVEGRIANFADAPLLSIGGDAAGPLADMLHFVHTTPVGGWIGQVLDEAQGSGASDLKLALSLPLDALATSKVKGSVALPGNDLHITPDTPVLAAAKGRIDFTEDSFAVLGATANVVGGELAFEGGMKAGGEVRFSGQGTASVDGLKRATELGPVAKLATVLSGQTAYRIGLGFAHGQSEISVTSNLVGIAADLPAPLHKPAEATLPMRYQTTLNLDPGAKADAVANRDTVRFELGSMIQAQYQRDLSGATPRVLRGGIGINEPAPTPASGVAAHVTLGSLNTEPWAAVATRLGGGESGGAEAGGYAPDTIALRTPELVAGARRLTHLVLGLSQDEGLWRANLDADQLSGYVEYRPARRGESAAAAGRVHARLARLSIPKGDVEQVETLLEQPPASVPALDIVVDDFELRGKRLGRVEIEAINSQGGAAGDGPREWRLAKFNISNPDAQLTATGHWIAAGGPQARRRAVLDFKLALADSGALLDRLGNPKAIRGGKGVMAGQVSWLGSPLTLDFPSMSGQMNVAIDSGQFLQVDPGAARLLGVLSLQSLPRRLALDFRDLFQEGFAFDNITGDVTIAQGVAQTNNFRMRGVQAAVLMDGRADIARETQDLRVVVVPEVNAGTASLAYAVINPVIGLGTFLAQLFLRKPLAEAGTREFHITGPWADPKVERVEHKSGDAVIEGDAPASDPLR